MWLNGMLGMTTRGLPSPSVQKAMLTPSAVCAYWIRGSMTATLYAIGKPPPRSQRTGTPYNGPVTVSDLGEFGLIDRLAKAVGAQRSPDLILGIGDDAAAWRFGDSVLLATTDTLVEGVHFLPSLTPYRDLGWKALAVHVSDIAAMGGEPLFALVTLALPPETPVSAVDDLYAGLNECAAEYAVTIGGGDVVRAPQLAITIALLRRPP